MRLQKFLSRAGVCSRRKAEVYIEAGRVRVNGKRVIQPGTTVDTEQDTIFLDGNKVELSREKERLYIALNKPRGYVSSCYHRGEKIILDLVNIERRVYPVGRLDKASTGLIILTDDGTLHHKLSHPSFDHEKEYVVKTVRAVSDNELKNMARGVSLNGRKTRKARIKRIGENEFTIVLKEGRNRQIRRMVKSAGNSVRSLKRVRISNVRLGSLKEGQWRYLTEDEIRRLTYRID